MDKKDLTIIGLSLGLIGVIVNAARERKHVPDDDEAQAVVDTIFNRIVKEGYGK